MSISLGSTSFGSLYLGSLKIGEAYWGSSKVYPSTHVDPYNPLNLPPYTMRFKFDSLLYDPTSVSGSTPGTWTQVSSDPNIWDFTYVNAVWGNTSYSDNSVFSNQKLYWSYGYDGSGIVHTGGVPWIHVLGANTSGVTNMSKLFGQTQGSMRAFADICLFDTSAVTDASYFMDGATGITAIPTYDLSKATTIRSAFNSTNAVTTAVVFDLSDCTNARSAFSGCGASSISLSNTDSITTFEETFFGCSNIKSIIIDASAATTLNASFASCTSLESVVVSNTSHCTNMNYMFSNCTSLASVNLFDTSIVTKMQQMFYRTAMVSIPLYNTSSVQNFYGFAMNCHSLQQVPLLNTSSATNVYSMFESCESVESGALALYNQMAGQTTPPSSHTRCFYNCGSNTVSGSAELAQIPTSWGGTMA